MIEHEVSAASTNVGKDGVRQVMRARRKALSAGERARAASVVCGKLAASSEIDAAFLRFGGPEAVCAVYLASADEIDLGAVVRAFLDRGVSIAAPRWNGATYELARLKGLKDENLHRGPMGVLEPKDADVVSPRDVSVWLVPGLAFTKDGRRLGYGGGWYDRLMAGADESALKIGIAYAFQIVGDLPSEPHDVRLDTVIDDAGT